MFQLPSFGRQNRKQPLRQFGRFNECWLSADGSVYGILIRDQRAPPSHARSEEPIGVKGRSHHPRVLDALQNVYLTNVQETKENILLEVRGGQTRRTFGSLEGVKGRSHNQRALDICKASTHHNTVEIWIKRDQRTHGDFSWFWSNHPLK